METTAERVFIGAHIPKTLYEQLLQACERNDRSLAAELRMCLRNSLERGAAGGARRPAPGA